jgi:sucrose phosphorylase
MGADGMVTPHPEHLEKLFMRKPDLPILRVCFPDGSRRAYWNTFYQKVEFEELAPGELAQIEGLHHEHATTIADTVNRMIAENACLEEIDLGDLSPYREDVLSILCTKRDYLGQMDLNARSELVWEFYDETLGKLAAYGARIIRLDAFAYLHKAPGKSNFFNRPGTWEYLERLRRLADEHRLVVFPEIHAEYGAGIHEEIAGEGFPVYDFFLPGLLIDALDRGDATALLDWIGNIQRRGLQTINMLGCHETIDGAFRPGLLDDAQIEATMQRVVDRGGRIKNLYGADGKKIAYYQVNATFFSALGEEENKLRLARAIQMFMPGIPQVWYLDLFAGRNDYAAADNGGPAGHKEINRSNLGLDEIEARLQQAVVRDQLALIRLRNTSPAFEGELELLPCGSNELHLAWRHPEATARLRADLASLGFTIHLDEGAGERLWMSHDAQTANCPSPATAHAERQ